MKLNYAIINTDKINRKFKINSNLIKQEEFKNKIYIIKK
ncbi:protein of unknown function [Tepidibacter aestuarii]|nr:protein of unknown function [Tepidibacter aestuarii]